MLWQEELRHFLATVESCLGPRASLKMTVSCTGHTTATSSSARLWDLIQVGATFTSHHYVTSN